MVSQINHGQHFLRAGGARLVSSSISHLSYPVSKSSIVYYLMLQSTLMLYGSLHTYPATSLSTTTVEVMIGA